MERIAALVDRHMDTHGPLEIDPVIVDEAFGLKPSVFPAGHRELDAGARCFE